MPDHQRQRAIRLVRSDDRRNDRLLFRHAGDPPERSEWVGEMDQQATTEHQIELADRLWRDIVDIDMLFDHLGAQRLLGDLERLKHILSTGVGGWAAWVHWAEIMIAPFRQFRCGDLCSAPLELEGKESARSANIEHTLAGQIAWKTVAVQIGPVIVLPRRHDSISKVYR